MTGLCTAVRIDHGGGSDWVVSSDAATYGRIEETFPARATLSDDDVAVVGNAYLAGRSTPLTSITARADVGAVPGVDYQQGDTVTLTAGAQRCVGINRKLTAVGDWEREPVLSSPVDESKRRAESAVLRVIESQGGGAVQATAAPSRVDIELGAVKKIETLKWAWYDSAASGSRTVLDDPSTWHDEQITQVCRMGSILCTVDYDGATGWSHFELFKNGSEWNPLFEIVMDDTPPVIPFAFVRVFGYEFLFPGDILTWRCTVNGQHRQGALAIDLVPAT